jgi:hypothetical protein
MYKYNYFSQTRLRQMTAMFALVFATTTAGAQAVLPAGTTTNQLPAYAVTPNITRSITSVESTFFPIETDGILLSVFNAAPPRLNAKRIVWLEFGDGKFTMNDTPVHVYRSTAPVDAVLKLTGLYDDGGRPPKGRVTRFTPPTTGNSFIEPNILADKQFVKITPNIGDIVPDDPMYFAVSYKKNQDIKQEYTWKLVFTYNTDVAGVAGRVFETTNPAALMNDGPASAPMARMHNAETINNDNTIRAAVRNHLGLPGTADFMVWDLPNFNDTLDERTVFVTLNPMISPQITSGHTPVNAYLVPFDRLNGRIINDGVSSFSQMLAINTTGPHDPNWEVVQPTCLVLPKAGQELKYQVHFQNTGAGDATLQVRVATKLPYGITPAMVNVTGATLAGESFPINSPFGSGPFNSNSYQLHVDRSKSDSIIYLFTARTSGYYLCGISRLLNPWCDNRTMGDVFFKFNAIPAVPNILTSRSSIYFDTEPAVVTEEARAEFKKCCKPCNCDGKDDNGNNGGTKPNRRLRDWLKTKCE